MMTIDMKSLENETIVKFLGADEGAKRAALTEFSDGLVPSARDFNVSTFRADKDDWQGIIATLHQSPMMAAKRLVIVEAIDKLKAANANHLMAYIEKPVPSSVLCLLGAKIEKRTKVGKALNKAGRTLSFDPPKPWEYPNWLVQEARKKGLSLNISAAQLVVESVGNNPELLRASLDTLGTYVGETQTIGSDDVESLVAHTRESNVWELINAVAQGNLLQAVRTLRSALSQGESSVGILIRLIGHYRQLAKYQALVQSNTQERELRDRLNIRSDRALSQLRQQASKLHIDRTIEHLQSLYAIETDIKRRSKESDSILERIIMDLV